MTAQRPDEQFYSLLKFKHTDCTAEYRVDLESTEQKISIFFEFSKIVYDLSRISERDLFQQVQNEIIPNYYGIQQ